MNNSKNDKAWEKLFQSHKILEIINDKGFYEISSADINKYREARLMTKFDHKSQLPKLFADNNLSILPISRGGYILGHFETFSSFNSDDIAVSPIEFPTNLESIDYREINSEATAINCAYVSRMLYDFTGDENQLPTVSGRMSSSSFSFKINSINGPFNISVLNSQIEIDAGYEGDNSLTLIEAKNYLSNDFLIRQLYYPLKLWSGKISKKIRPIFLTYSNGIFHLREYFFSDLDNYNSLELVGHKKYVVQGISFNLEGLYEILEKTPEVSEPNIPFPQANSFDRVINLCELLFQNGFISKYDITSNYDFDPRQTDYYINAAIYLGLIELERDLNGQIGCVLSTKGKSVFNLQLQSRQIEFVRLIVSHKIFNRIIKLHLTNAEMPSINTIVEEMSHSNLYNVQSESTYHRRASTIIGWTNWVLGLVET